MQTARQTWHEEEGAVLRARAAAVARARDAATDTVDDLFLLSGPETPADPQAQQAQPGERASHREAEGPSSPDAAGRRRRPAANGQAVFFQLALRPDGAAEFRHVAEGARHLFGWTPEQLRADPSLLPGAMPPDDRARFLASAREAAHSGQPWRFEGQFRHGASGAARWLGALAQPERLPGGEVLFDGFLGDVSERRWAEAERRVSEERFRFLVEVMDDIVTLHDAKGGILYLLPSDRRVLGYDYEDAVGVAPDTRAHPEDRERVRRAFRRLRRTGEPVTLVWRCRHQSGDYLYLETKAKAMRGEAGGVGGQVLCVSRDVTERLRAEERLRWQADHDALTGLPNRMRFQRLLQQSIRTAEAGRHDLAVLYLDLDGFKQVNDSLGHHIGDDLLILVARRLAATAPPGVTVARMGGDEFTLLVPAPSALGRSGRALGDEVARLAARVLEMLAEPIPLHGHDLFITGSLGLAVYPYDGDDADTLLRHADVAMYAAKDQGNSQFQRHTEAMNVAAFDRLLLENSLRRAVLDQSGFEVRYQPRVRLKTGAVDGVEALLRWDHPEFRGIPSPRFLPLAEETGLIRPLGEWVLRQACGQAARLRAAGGPVRVAVNLSARQVGQPGLVRLVESALSEAGLPAGLLELEFTEAALMKNGENAATVLNDLKALGVGLSVDDFGTGYSSLSYLRRFPLDVVKIDRSFVLEVAADPRNEAVVRAVVDLAHALSLDVVAEGIETEEQRRLVADLGCDAFQGNLLCPPVPADVLRERLWPARAAGSSRAAG